MGQNVGQCRNIMYITWNEYGDHKHVMTLGDKAWNGRLKNQHTNETNDVVFGKSNWPENILGIQTYTT